MVDDPKRPIPAEMGDKPMVAVDYIKGTSFRTVVPSGVVTSLTPQGEVQIGFFSERQAIPQRVVYALNEDGSLGNIIERIGRDAIVREMETVITLNADLAENLARRLDEMTAELKTQD